MRADGLIDWTKFTSSNREEIHVISDEKCKKWVKDKIS